MALPQPAMAIPREITSGTLELTTKPGASIYYTFAQGNNTHLSRNLVVFLNGLIADKSSWLAVIAGVIRARETTTGFPSMLAYDRYGQGLTEDRDPQDRGREEGHGHDVADVVEDLHQIISHIVHERLHKKPEEPHIVFVANSIGCAIARLYAQTYPGKVAALLLLDSIMANSDFDFWPDPDAKDFSEDELPNGVTVEILREQRAKFAAMFSPQIINPEGLSRRNLPELLPASDGPKLVGPDHNKGPWVTVAGHDFEHFALESHRIMGTPISLSMQYTNPIWHAYNMDLVKLTDETRRRGPVVAQGCGHFIQRDDPNFVVGELCTILDKLSGICGGDKILGVE